MNRLRERIRWKLADLIDFENGLSELSGWQKAWRSGVREELAKRHFKSEKGKRRAGFRLLLEEVRGVRKSHLGEKVETASKLVGAILGAVMFVLGVGLIRGLLVPFAYQELSGEGNVVVVDGRGFNVWSLLMITLGVQWLLLLAGVLGYFMWRRWSGALSLLQSVFGVLVKKLSGGDIERTRWRDIVRGGGRAVWGWRMTRMLQIGAVGYNLGLLVGLFGCLMFLNVEFYWETTLPHLGAETLAKTTQVLSFNRLPMEVLVGETQLGYQSALNPLKGGALAFSGREHQPMGWAVFFFFVLIVWGLLPRVILWLVAVVSEYRALGAMEFKEAGHRKLWRELTSVSRGEVTTTQSDGVVVLDVGGVEMSNDVLRPFFLQELRVNPEQRYSLGTLNEEQSKAALEAARVADSGVVFLVEGWSLSPKQMRSYHAQVRCAIGSHLIRYVMIGSGDELVQWRHFVDELRDSECEVYLYKKSEKR